MLAYVGAQRLDFYDDLLAVVTHLGRLQYRVPGMPVAAFQIAEDAREVGLSDANWQHIAALQMHYGYARRTGEHDKAIAQLCELLDHAAAQTAVWLELASLYMAEGRYPHALEALRSFRAIELGEVTGLVYQANALNQLKRHSEALVVAQQAAVLAADDARACTVRANVSTAKRQ